MRRPHCIARQARRASGILGYIVAQVMAKETAPENALALDLLDLASGDRILEVGCGHGATLFAAASRACDLKLTGVDHSEVMLRVARRRNRHLVATGRMTLDHGDSACLCYDDGTFTKVFAVHTIYFWPQPEVHLREIQRVLMPGGRFVLGFQSREDTTFSAQFPAAVYHIRPAADVAALVAASGFDQVRTQSRLVNARLMTWVIARKASGGPDAYAATTAINQAAVASPPRPL